MTTCIVWFRNDLRVCDLPALAAAADEFDYVVPVFVVSQQLVSGRSSSKNRNTFLTESLQDLDANLRGLGGRLVLRTGDAAQELLRLADETGARHVYCSEDLTPFARARDEEAAKVLAAAGVAMRVMPGRLAVDDVMLLRTKSDTVFKVFTPFYRSWLEVARREVLPAPSSLRVPDGIEDTPIVLSDGGGGVRSPDTLKGGETAARQRLEQFIAHSVDTYGKGQDDMAADTTSRLSAYLHFGCLSPREAEAMLPDTAGAHSWRRQLAWREYYHYILAHFPETTHQPFQQRYKDMIWADDRRLFDAWKAGKTGYPVVDAAMRQLLREGWMHNRARLIVGSFFTKDLWLDWRKGEEYFMQMLIDGDTANNNGNWQWITSIGVDPAPVFRRLYNPTSQQQRYDPSGEYVRRYVPELADVPAAFIAEPWKMTLQQQQEARCIIGVDYPAPIVDHAIARKAALDAYREA